MPDLGVGFLDIEPAFDLYGENYWQQYRALDRTSMGEALTEARCEFVRRNVGFADQLVDVGIGGGRFVEVMNCFGWDVNPHAQAWLHQHQVLHNLPRHVARMATFWDSLEHMRNPSECLRNVRQWAFVSMPIYTDAAHARASKHFKPGEHLWYFTARGLCTFMEAHGFVLREVNSMESDLGRDGIDSFAFERAA